MKMKKLLSMMLAFAMTFSISAVAFATEVGDESEPTGLTTGASNITESGTEQRVPVEVTVEGTTFSVTVPTSLPAHVAADGTIVVATNCSIINGSSAAIQVKNVVIDVDEAWTVGNFADDFSVMALNSKVFGLEIAGVSVAEDKSYDFATAFPQLEGGETRDFNYALKIAPQTEAMSNAKIAEIVFTISWANAENESIVDPGTGEETGD